MANRLLQSTTGNAGRDELIAFLEQYKNELQILDATTLNSWHHKLTEAGFRYQDLMDLESEGLKAALSESGLESLEVSRIISVLTEIPETFSYKQADSAKVIHEMVHAIISPKSAMP